MTRTMTIIIAMLIFQNCVNYSYADSKNEEIIKLEQEKAELFKQINEAIDESVKSLVKSNDSELATGIQFMTDLKNQIKEIHDNGMKIEVSEAGRRAFNNSDHRRNPKLTVTLEELQKIFKVKTKQWSPKEVKYRDDEMRLVIDKWMAQKKLEAQKIKEYREKRKVEIMAGTREKCPDFGEGKNSVKGGNGRKRKRTYPCCRKCCKKSYLGCL